MKLPVDPPGQCWQSASVTSYCGHRADERPLSFTVREHCYKVVEIVDRWHEGHAEAGTGSTYYFKARTTTGEIFLLRHDIPEDTWSVKALNDPGAVMGVC